MMSRPLPRATAQTQAFWDGCAHGVVRYQRCADCATVQTIPRSLCTCCQSDALVWHEASGFGHVLSYTRVYRAPIPAFRAEVPYVIALVDMDEGFRLMVNVAGEGDAALAIGSRVRIAFREVEGVVLPHAQICPGT